MKTIIEKIENQNENVKQLFFKNSFPIRFWVPMILSPPCHIHMALEFPPFELCQHLIQFNLIKFYLLGAKNQKLNDQ